MSDFQYMMPGEKFILRMFAIAILLSPVMGETSEPQIKIGMSTALSGPAQSLGEGMKTGIEVYLERINQEGGVHDRKLKLVTIDDGYVPEAAAANMMTLIDKDKVLAVVGNVGTPTAKVAVPIAIDKKTLLFGAFTGAGILRPDPPSRYVINYRASYVQETAAMVRGLLKQGILPYQIAIFSQNDAYGDAGFAGVMQGLEDAGYEHGFQLAHGRYERNTQDVEQGLIKIMEASIEPRAIIMIGAYAACAKFIRIARRALPNTMFLNVSFVGSTALKNALGAASEGVIVTQVVPHFNSELPLIEEYRQDLARFAPGIDPGFVSLEGYVVARIFVEGVRRAGPEIDNLDIGLGIPISFSKVNHQGSHMVWPTVIKGNRFVPLDFESLQ